MSKCNAKDIKHFQSECYCTGQKCMAVRIEKGKSYQALKKAVQIVVSNFEWLPKSHFHSMFQITDSEDGTIFSSHLEMHILELPKLQKESLEKTNDLEKWILFMKGDKKTKEALAVES